MDDDQQFCLRWNNHQSTLVAVFDTLLENEKLVDCTLAAEGKFLNAHKVVLSACSPYFESLLSRHYDKHPILILKDVKFQELKAMMDYMYRGEVNISQDQLGALLKAAESLQIKGLSDNKKEEPAAKRAAPAAAPPKSPQTQSAIPKVQGLTIEQRSRDEREGSISPGPRKKKRMRRKSEEMDNHHDASNSSDAPQNIPSATTQLPVNIKMNNDVPDTIETKQEILRHKDESGSQLSQVPMIKEKLETHTELMLEPKSEYADDMNEDSIEDLTLDDDDLSNMEQQMDDGAGPSHGGEGSSQQGFGHWQMGNQSQDEVFLAAQEAVGAHRDSQGYTDGVQKVRYTYSQVDYPRRAKFQAPLPATQPPMKAFLKPLKSAMKKEPPQQVEKIDRPPSRRASGLLTDSLSCIFTRRANEQRKVPQQGAFYEQPSKEISDTESTAERKTFEVPMTAPEPPRISQPTPDISMEDWFAAKQRILGNVKPQTPVEPVKTHQEVKTSKPALVDPHGFDIEPPTNINKNVSPYVPSHSLERDEYEKYKSEKINLAMLQKRHSQSEETSHEIAYEGNEEYEAEDEDMEKYHIERESYASVETQAEYYYQEDAPQEYYSYPSDNFKEPLPVSGGSTQNMCHKCSFQTTNLKKLRDHLKFVHGEDAVVGGSSTTNELYSRREGQEDLFTRRGEQPRGGKFKRRNTSVLVNVVSNDVVTPPSRDESESLVEGDEVRESGVMAAMEYFESTKNQPRKVNPYRRSTDQLDKEWI
ncbi:longitudinals lacking protein-like isoform X1 [Euwallacea similis]|uniref:longitudinals lacking protein-like isoform X1 n=1 Tax=Euwallacea similis TaxID=1736056 RepID=UPI00344F32A7